MRHGLKSLLLILTSASSAFASSPGMIEGPNGCSWKATVVTLKAHQIDVSLDRLAGCCVYHVRTGTEGQKMTLKRPTGFSAKPGASIEIWLEEGAAEPSLEIPSCHRKPIQK